MITNEDLIKIGFVKIHTFTVGNNVIYQLGRNRHLSASCVGTPNEMLFISERDTENTNIIAIHNYDYDGYLSIERVNNLIDFFSNKEIKKDKYALAINEIENAMERWHHARDNDDETLQNINDILVEIGLLSWFNKK